MTTALRHDQRVMQIFKAASATILTIGMLCASLLLGKYLLDHRLPQQSSYQVSCIILVLASINFGTAIMLDPFRYYYSKFTPPAIVSMAALVLLFAIAESFNRFLGHFGYGFLTPFVIACQGLIYVTLVLEKNIALKCLLGLDSIAVILLWELGAAGNFTMPF